ncbi:MAG: L-2-amino-thiazoline-4-carboxylic acid hydrolase [Burkholderiales bacterium]|nr:MAG: L-2-amino-thiazoline-4-carboxylic acid hydrolase [Burkholderiales bacterium]
MSHEDTLRAQLWASFKNRAMVYYEVYKVLEEEFGAQRAAELLKRAIYRRGCAIGQRFSDLGPGDLAGLEKAFLAFIPDQGRVFEPRVIRSDGEALEIQLGRCPLKEAWLEAGLTDGEVARMCEIAGVVDNGTFEAAGFGFRSETWQPGREGCCHLFISKGA